jgi:hypothetical protein
MPVRSLYRFFGGDCFTHFYKADAHVRGKKQRKDDYLTWDQCEKLPLSDGMYMPLQHSRRKGTSAAHTKEMLFEYLEKQNIVEISASDYDTVSFLDQSHPSLPLHIRRNHTDVDLGHPVSHAEMTRSRTFVANQELKEQTKWFGAAVRRYMNDSPDVPIYDQALRDLMGRCLLCIAVIDAFYNRVQLIFFSFPLYTNRTPYCKSSKPTQRLLTGTLSDHAITQEN